MTLIASAIPENPAILFLDDEVAVLHALQRVFRRHQGATYFVDNGSEALEVLQDNVVDLVVSDMRMPGMDGVEFLERVASEWPHTKRILLTGYADMEATVNAINKGKIHSYLTKPWNNDELRSSIEQMIELCRLERENAALAALTTQQNAELEEANSKLEKRVSERTAQLRLANRKLKDASMRTTEMMLGLLNLRDDHAASHGRRVAKMVQLLASRFDLPEEMHEQMYIAALLHDIGKLGFSDDMLNSAPDELPAKLRHRYEKHSVVAEATLMSIDAFTEAAGYIRMHHERIDGTGFPDGLSGNEVPLPAQIIGLASYCDDLSQGLHGQEPLEGEELIRLLQKKAGTWWQEDVVTALVSLLHDKALQCERGEDRLLPLDELEPGMALSRDVCTEDGRLLLSAGMVLEAALIGKLARFQKESGGALSFYIQND
jgi:response regulator RpfG family c-di-GMP phosphodiesterase